MGKKMEDSEKKVCMLSVRLTKEQHQQLRNHATRVRSELSDVVLTLLIAHKIIEPSEQKQKEGKK